MWRDRLCHKVLHLLPADRSIQPFRLKPNQTHPRRHTRPFRLPIILDTCHDKPLVAEKARGFLRTNRILCVFRVAPSVCPEPAWAKIHVPHSTKESESSKKGLFEPFIYIYITMILPRQARDKHREHSKKRGVRICSSLTAGPTSNDNSPDCWTNPAGPSTTS